ncbi:MAG: hypothetical protein GY855_11465 [candidate division Zixibacteria bacterium]|nr:hypothetical protein [candidate division Zixibacteria bacterium]
MSYFYSSLLLKDIACKVVRASAIFKLIEDSDRIAVTFSGGKDSFTLLKCCLLSKPAVIERSNF